MLLLQAGQSGYDGSSDAWLLEQVLPSNSSRQTLSSGVLLCVYAKAGNAILDSFRCDGSSNKSISLILQMVTWSVL